MAPTAELATAYVTLVSSAKGLGESITGELDKAGKDAEAAGEKSGGLFAGAFGVAIAGIAVIGGAAVAALTKGMEAQAANADLAASLGLTDERASELGAVAGRVYASNFGENMEEVRAGVESVSQILGRFGDTSAASIEAATGKALNLAGVLGIEVPDAANLAGRLVQSGLAANTTEAFDQITAGAQNTAVNLRGDLVDAVNEYAGSFQQIGFDGTAAFGLLSQASAGGAIQLDKAGDAIKEFTIRSTDMSTSSVAAYQALGLNATETSNALLAGGDGARAAFDNIVAGLQGIQDPATQANTAIALFGTPLEDIGTNKVPEFLNSLGQAGTVLGDVEGAADRMGATLSNTLQSQVTQFGRTFSQAATDVGLVFMPALTSIATEINGRVGPAVTAGVGYLKDFAAIAGAGFTFLGSGDLTAFDGLADDGSRLADMFVALKPTIDAIGGAFKTVAGVVGPVLASISREVGGTLLAAFTAIATTAGSVFGQLGPIFAQIVPAIAPLLGLLNPIGLVLKALIPILPVLADAFGQIAVAVGGALVTALGQITPLFPLITQVIAQVVQILAEGLMQAIAALVPVVLALVDVFSAVIPVVVQLVSTVLPQIAPLFAELVPAIVSVVQSLTTFLVPAIEALLPVVVTVFQALGPIIQAAMDIVKGIIEVVVGIIDGDWQRVWGGIQTFFQGIWDGINAFIQGAVDILKGILSAAWEIIKPAAEGAWNLVKTYIITPLTDAYNWVRDVFSGISAKVGSIFDAVKAAAKVVLDTLYGVFIEPFNNVINWIGNTFSGISGKVSGVFSTLKVVAGVVLDTLYETFIAPFANALGWVKSVFQGIVGIVTGIVQGIKDAWNDLKRFLSTPLTINSSLVNGTLGIGSIPGNATGGIYDPRPGGHIVQVAEAGKRELITPVDLMADTFRAVLDGTTITGSPGQDGGRSLTGGGDIIIRTQDPDVEGALDRLLFQAVA